MVEVRSYEGTLEALTEFVVRVWRETYGHRMAFPLWTVDYLRWQLELDHPDSPRDHLVAAYEGDQLVGTVLGFPVRFRTAIGEMEGTQGSWLSIDPAYRRQGVATALRTEFRRRHQQLGLAFQVGYGYFGSKHSMGPSFWNTQRKLGMVEIGRAGFWARVLDPKKAAAWNVVSWEGWLTRLSGPLLRNPRVKPGGCAIRPYAPQDLPACLEIVQKCHAKLDFAVVWTEERLARHLEGGGVGQCLVAEQDGRAAGLISFHCLPFLGRTEEIVGILDIVAIGELPRREQVRLLNAALAEMQSQQAVLALKLRIGDYPAGAFLTAGFVPRLTDSYILVNWAEEVKSLPAPRSLHLLWR